MIMGLLEEDMARMPDLRERAQEKASEIITELDNVLSQKHPKQKSVLISENIIGMNRADAMQKHLEEYYGFRIVSLDELCESKRSLVKSREGVGINNLINIVKTLQAQFQAQIMPGPPSAIDNLMGKRPNNGI
jgi:predicted ribonuclease YlaK